MRAKFFEASHKKLAEFADGLKKRMLHYGDNKGTAIAGLYWQTYHKSPLKM